MPKFFVKVLSILRSYEKRRQDIVTHLTFHNLRHLVLKGGDLDLDAESHLIFIIRRNGVDDLRKVYLEPISANVEIRVMMTVNTLMNWNGASGSTCTMPSNSEGCSIGNPRARVRRHIPWTRTTRYSFRPVLRSYTKTGCRH